MWEQLLLIALSKTVYQLYLYGCPQIKKCIVHT